MCDNYCVLQEIILHAIDAGFKNVWRVYPLRGYHLMTYDDWEIEIIWGSQTMYLKNKNTYEYYVYRAPFYMQEILEKIYSITGAYLPEDWYDVEYWEINEEEQQEQQEQE